MRNNFSKIFYLIYFLLLSQFAFADLAPVYMGGKSLHCFDNKFVQMKSESVDIKKDREFFKIRVKFTMYNSTDKDRKMMIGFPIQSNIKKTGIYDFKVTYDKKENIGKLKKGKVRVFKHHKQHKWEWFSWESIFHPGNNIVYVEYNIPINRSYGKNRKIINYIFSTGKYWKGNIEKAVLVLHFSDYFSKGQILSYTSPNNVKFFENKAEWTFEDFNPTFRDDWRLEFIPKDIIKKINQLKENIKLNIQLEVNKIKLSRIYLSMVNHRQLSYLPKFIPEYDFDKLILPKLKNANDRKLMVSYYKKMPIGKFDLVNEIGEYDSRNKHYNFTIISKNKTDSIYKILKTRNLYTTDPNRLKLFELFNKIQYREKFQYHLLLDSAEDYINEILKNNPQNSEAWNLKLAYYYKLYYYGFAPLYYNSMKPIFKNQEKIIKKAFKFCPEDEEIKLWYRYLIENRKIPEKISLMFNRGNYFLTIQMGTIRYLVRINEKELAFLLKYYKKEMLEFSVQVFRNYFKFKKKSFYDCFILNFLSELIKYIPKNCNFKADLNLLNKKFSKTEIKSFRKFALKKRIRSFTYIEKLKILYEKYDNNLFEQK